MLTARAGVSAQPALASYCGFGVAGSGEDRLVFDLEALRRGYDFSSGLT